MELLLWLEQIEIWRLEREHAVPKQEQLESSEDDELPLAVYPGSVTYGSQPVSRVSTCGYPH
jgi:hypothetical protein